MRRRAPWSTTTCAAAAAGERGRVALSRSPPPRASAGHPRAERRPCDARCSGSVCAYVATGRRQRVCLCRHRLLSLRSARRAMNRRACAGACARSRPVRLPSGGTIGAGHAAAPWLHTAHWYTATPSLPRVGDPRVLCAPACGTGSRFGTGMGAGQRGGHLADHVRR